MSRNSQVRRKNKQQITDRARCIEKYRNDHAFKAHQSLMNNDRFVRRRRWELTLKDMVDMNRIQRYRRRLVLRNPPKSK